MTIKDKLRKELRANGYQTEHGSRTELSKEQMEKVNVGGADWFESFDSGPTGNPPSFWKSIVHRTPV